MRIMSFDWTVVVIRVWHLNVRANLNVLLIKIHEKAYFFQVVRIFSKPFNRNDGNKKRFIVTFRSFNSHFNGVEDVVP